MSENLENFKFLKETVSKFKGEIQKLLVNPNYTNAGVIQLKQNIDEIEKNINYQQKTIINSYLNEKKTVNSNHKLLYQYPTLPKLRQKSARVLNYFPNDDVYITVKYEKQSKLDRLKNYRNNQEINAERLNYINNMKKRKPKNDSDYDINFRQTQFDFKKNQKNLLNKYGINSDFYDRIKVTNKRPNFMDPSKRIKYSVTSKKFLNNKILYDKNKQPIIQKEELNKGLLNMVYKGLIPKGADLSPAFNNNGGNPLQINNNAKNIFAKTFYKDDYDTNSFINQIDNKYATDDNFFITKPKDVIIKKLPLPINDEEEEKKIEIQKDNKLIEEKSINLSSQDKTKENKNKEKEKIKRKTLIFSNFKVVENEQFHNFSKENQDKWGGILYLFEHLGKLFRKLNIPLVECYQDKIIELASDEMRYIQNKDLILCMTEKDLLSRNLDPNHPIKFYASLKEKFIIQIQKHFRAFLSKKKVQKIKEYFKKIKYIQHMFRSIKKGINARNFAKQLFECRYNDWISLQNTFKRKWKTVKTKPRIEIHIDNISLSCSNSLYMNTTFNKFLERENNQLNRIINLYDSNVEIIYITPHELNKDIITYYISIMKTLGVENVRERFHIFVPENSKILPPHFSVTQLLLLSPNTINEIKNYINNKEAYIVPGKGGKYEVELSILMNIPILMGDLFQNETVFTKSGAKLIFEACELNIPVSAWDIKSEFEFYASLSHLIVCYPNYNIWVFKIDNEVNGRGIAYIQLDRIQSYLELKKSKDKYEDKKKYEFDLSECLKKSIPKKIKIICNNLYKSWDEYFKYYIENRGIIEACPTFNPNNIIGSPAVPIFIAPDGNIEVLPSYDKINLYNFRNVGAISPQKSLPITKKNDYSKFSYNHSNNNEEEEESSISSFDNDNMNIYKIGEKIGKYLYKHDVIGYVTVELIVFKNYNISNTKDNILNYWGIDIKFGLDDVLSCIRFCNFIYNHATDKLQLNDNNLINISLNQENKNINDDKCQIFVFPFLANKKISEIKMNDLVKAYRNDNLIFDVEKKRGIVFNFSDTLECGNIGVCGILNLEDIEIRNLNLELWKLIQNSLNIISLAIKISEHQPLVFDERTDYIDIVDIFNKINKHYNNLVIADKNEKKEKN